MDPAAARVYVLPSSRLILRARALPRVSLCQARKRWGDDLALTNCDRTQTWTFNEYWNESVRFAKSLLQVGFQPFQSVNIIGFNSAEWMFADIGCILAQGIAAGIYTTNGPEACLYVSKHSDASVVVCEGEKQLAKFAQILGQLPLLKALVVYNVECVPAQYKSLTVPVYTFEEFQALGESDGVDRSGELQARMDAQQPGSCCTLIYTSGPSRFCRAFSQVGAQSGGTDPHRPSAPQIRSQRICIRE